MGQLIDGVWHDTWYDTKSTGGRFKRTEAVWRNWVTADGSAGPTGKAGFAAERGRCDVDARRKILRLHLARELIADLRAIPRGLI